MEPPECPVCLQSYNNATTIPRVLSCGHSACQTCLTNLHHHSSSISLLPHTLRCPCCTQLIKFPHPQGATALPKNIDLLRFHNQTPNLNPQTNNNHPLTNVKLKGFRPKIWSDGIYAAWKDWILPNCVVLRNDECNGRITVDCDFVGLSLSVVMRCLLVGNQEVGLVCIGRFELYDHDNDPMFEYSYLGKVISVLCQMDDAQRNEISSLFGISMKNSRLCKVFGLWLDDENDGCLFIVIRKMKNGLLNLGNGLLQNCEEFGLYLGSLGTELCEVLMSLHSEGYVCGCLGLSCLCLDEFGHVCVNIGEALLVGRKLRECVVKGVMGGQKGDGFDAGALAVKMSNMDTFVSPEVLIELLHREGFIIKKDDESFAIEYASDIWLIACALIRLLIGNQFVIEMSKYLKDLFQGMNEGISKCISVYMIWVETVDVALKPLMVDDCASVYKILLKCLDFDPRNRPLAIDVWKCLKGLNIRHSSNHAFSLEIDFVKDDIDQCLVLGDLCNVSNDQRNDLRISSLCDEQGDCKPETSVDGEVRLDNVVKGLPAGKVQCKDLQGHRDCISGLCVGGGFLFSSSFDKTINVWSLQDFTHVHTFRGHEHKVMALVFVNQATPLCISADSGGGIFAWEINESLAQEPLMKWYEEKDWRYSGIHALAVSESGCLYTGSGDRLIKAWLLKDHTLLCCMEGHKSVVSTLALFNGVLYSGSWDGTVRLWSLHDHSPLGIFSEDIAGTVSSVLSLFANQNMIVAVHENGCIKIWMNDSLKISTKVNDGAIFSLAVEGKWMYFGGWDRTVNVQEIATDDSEMGMIDLGSIACDSVITALLCVQGILFVGCANKLIKVYHCGT